MYPLILPLPLTTLLPSHPSDFLLHKLYFPFSPLYPPPPLLFSPANLFPLPLPPSPHAPLLYHHKNFSSLKILINPNPITTLKPYSPIRVSTQ